MIMNLSATELLFVYNLIKQKQTNLTQSEALVYDDLLQRFHDSIIYALSNTYNKQHFERWIKNEEEKISKL